LINNSGTRPEVKRTKYPARKKKLFYNQQFKGLISKDKNRKKMKKILKKFTNKYRERKPKPSYFKPFKGRIKKKYM